MKTKAPARRRRVYRKRTTTKPKRVMRKKGNVPDVAKCSVKISLLDPRQQPFLVNTMYDLHNINLSQFDRAVAISKAYQFYRIKKVALTYKIGYDTYQAAAGGPTRPNFYYMLDKSQSIPQNVNLEGLKQMGARPRACDEKPIRVQWSPAVLTEDQSIGGLTAAQYKISPWLNTNQNNLGAFAPSLVQHNGVYWFVQMDAVAGVGYQYSAEMEIQFEFKKPLWTANISATPSLGAVPAPTNNSPDGLVGGGDEEVITVLSSGKPVVH